MSMHVSRLIFLFCLFLASTQLAAQVVVDVSTERSLYLAYEPLLLTVRIHNLSGNALLLADDASHQWFSFCVETLSGLPIAPSNPHDEVAPISLHPGEMLSRTINLTSFYPLGDFGTYRLRAMVYVPEFHRYFSSSPRTIEITEGRLLWQQSVGIPSKEQGVINKRTVALLSHRNAEHTLLYLRIDDSDHDSIFCTYSLGPMIAHGKPEVLFDRVNHIHLLFQEAPGYFSYVHSNLDGKVIARRSWRSSNNHPSLVLTPQGTVHVSSQFSGNYQRH